ncbi:hypothetical protein [Gracilibacillus sp. JCM 18860]
MNKKEVKLGPILVEEEIKKSHQWGARKPPPLMVADFLFLFEHC